MAVRMAGVTDRNWLVIGGAGGIGSAVATQLAKEMEADGTDATIWITSRTEEKAAAVAERIDGGRRVRGAAVDTTDETSVRALWQRVQSAGITRLAYCAGGVQEGSKTPLGGSILDLGPTAVRAQFDVTFYGPLIVQHIIGRGMLDQSCGTDGKLDRSVVFIHTSSASADKPLPRVGPYSAAMRALDSMIGSWQRELVAQYGPLVRVVGVRPGFVPTEQNSALLLDPSAADGLTERGRTVSAGSIIGRLGRPEEIAPAYLFLAEESSSFILGTILDVCGGYLKRPTL